ncbi:MAG: metallophosphoesterase [Spirulina sp. SIO3F2]|nr:metallophosphoesterase [Spirulina sp. SIO3F2]
MPPFRYRLGIISDPHIALPETIWQHQSRFHLVEVSLSAFEQAIARFQACGVDALLLPGDLTQHGELVNHHWLQQTLTALPFPAYVVPGNHDVIYPRATDGVLGLAEFPSQYAAFGYSDAAQPWYHCALTPGLHLVGLNSNQFDADGNQQGYLDEAQLDWLVTTLTELRDRCVIVMVHHNSVEHLPDQLNHPLGRRYMLDNAPQVRQVLRDGGVRLVFTGHLHVQDIAQQDGIWEIATGSLVSYPHPYRVVELCQDDQGQLTVQIESFHITQAPGYENLQDYSRDWIGDRSFPFMKQLAELPPLNLPETEADELAKQLRYFWAEIAEGDRTFSFAEQPPAVQQWLERFSAGEPQQDNQALLRL